MRLLHALGPQLLHFLGSALRDIECNSGGHTYDPPLQTPNWQFLRSLLRHVYCLNDVMYGLLSALALQSMHPTVRHMYSHCSPPLLQSSRPEVVRGVHITTKQ